MGSSRSCLTDPVSSCEHLMDGERLWMLCTWAFSKAFDHCLPQHLLDSIVLAAHGLNTSTFAGEQTAWLAGPREWWWSESSWQQGTLLCPRAQFWSHSLLFCMFELQQGQVLPLGHNKLLQLQAGEERLGRAWQERAWGCWSTACAQVGKTASGTWPGSAVVWPAGPGQ